MLSELARLIDAVYREKNIPRETLIELIEGALVAAARKRYGPNRDLEAHYSEELGEVELFEFKTVVDEVEDDALEIEFEEARDLDPECEVGDSLGIKMDVDRLGRIAAQTAKQVIIQKIRDAEREMTFNEFRDRKGELITGIVRRFEKGNIIVDLGRAEAILPKREQVPTETYRQGDRLQAYVLDITRASKSPQVVLSRTHPGLLMKLFELEVPEIYEGIVRIEACAREPGHRAKIAVSSTDPDVDPVGACVGLKGSRVQAVVQELRGEAIDIIPFHPDPARFIVHAIAPATVTRVYMDEHIHTMELIVPDDQLSKAIGRRGQNVRLAAQLTGWRIDIYSETRHAEMNAQAQAELELLEDLDAEEIEQLIRHGYRSAQELTDADPFEVASILGIDEDRAEAIVIRAEDIWDQLEQERMERERREAEERAAQEQAEADSAAEGEHEAEGESGPEPPAEEDAAEADLPPTADESPSAPAADRGEPLADERKSADPLDSPDPAPAGKEDLPPEG